MLQNRTRKNYRMTKYEENIIKENYERLNARGIINTFGLKLSIGQIVKKAYSLGLKANEDLMHKHCSIKRKELFKDKEFKNNYIKERRKNIIYSEIDKIVSLYKNDKICCKKISELYGLKTDAGIKMILKEQGIKLPKSGVNGKIWEDKDIEYLKNNYFRGDKNKIMLDLNTNWPSIMHKANRLKILRDQKYFQKEGTIHFNKTDNPTWRPEVKEKIKKKMKELIENNPEKLLNRRLKRNKITSLEKRVKKILDKHNVEYKYNTYIKTNRYWRFPDFLIGNLIIECDGKRFHEDKEKESIRDRELINEGYTILHFSQDMINKNIEKVERCILKRLNQLGILAKNKLTI